jgi:hypothetical protein
MTTAPYRSNAVSILSTATASNLPGPGRFIGNLYSRGDRILERSMSLIAHKLRYGPYAVSFRMHRLIPTRDVPLPVSHVDGFGIF